eukprot:55802-Eustigmatos_ZCMA.PRE.1
MKDPVFRKLGDLLEGGVGEEAVDAFVGVLVMVVGGAAPYELLVTSGKLEKGQYMTIKTRYLWEGMSGMVDHAVIFRNLVVSGGVGQAKAGFRVERPDVEKLRSEGKGALADFVEGQETWWEGVKGEVGEMIKEKAGYAEGFVPGGGKVEEYG